MDTSLTTPALNKKDSIEETLICEICQVKGNRFNCISFLFIYRKFFMTVWGNWLSDISLIPKYSFLPHEYEVACHFFNYPMIFVLIVLITCTIYPFFSLQPCTHTYCGGCYSEWMAHSKQCPAVRNTILHTLQLTIS